MLRKTEVIEFVLSTNVITAVAVAVAALNVFVFLHQSVHIKED